MWWAPVLLLALLSPASQKSSNLEGRTKSVTRPTGSSAEITCDLPEVSSFYIHWYLHQEGKAPQRLLYYDSSNSRVVLESGISSGKYDSYGSTRRRNLRLRLQNLIENDSGVYYCANWDRHSDSDLLNTTLKICRVAASSTQDRTTPSHFLPPNLLYAEQEKHSLTPDLPYRITLPWQQLPPVPHPPPGRP
uniref:Ig-like domain-containing protein n=1 Tax=Papio anubis TaxID=9555 RepID=A0A8I5NJ48_PAPAN